MTALSDKINVIHVAAEPVNSAPKCRGCGEELSAVKKHVCAPDLPAVRVLTTPDGATYATQRGH